MVHNGTNTGGIRACAVASVLGWVFNGCAAVKLLPVPCLGIEQDSMSSVSQFEVLSIMQWIPPSSGFTSRYIARKFWLLPRAREVGRIYAILRRAMNNGRVKCVKHSFVRDQKTKKLVRGYYGVYELTSKGRAWLDFKEKQ